MSDVSNPNTKPGCAAQEVVLELIRAGQIKNAQDAATGFSVLFDHYTSEQKRIKEQFLDKTE